MGPVEKPLARRASAVSLIIPAGTEDLSMKFLKSLIYF
jgi:hypothetical protein